MKMRQLLTNTRLILQQPQLRSNTTSYYCKTDDVQVGLPLPPVVVRCDSSDQLNTLYTLLNPHQNSHPHFSSCHDTCRYLGYLFNQRLKSLHRDDQIIQFIPSYPIIVLVTNNVDQELLNLLTQAATEIIDRHMQCDEQIFRDEISIITTNNHSDNEYYQKANAGITLLFKLRDQGAITSGDDLCMRLLKNLDTWDASLIQFKTQLHFIITCYSSYREQQSRQKKLLTQSPSTNKTSALVGQMVSQLTKLNSTQKGEQDMLELSDIDQSYFNLPRCILESTLKIPLGTKAQDYQKIVSEVIHFERLLEGLERLQTLCTKTLQTKKPKTVILEAIHCVLLKRTYLIHLLMSEHCYYPQTAAYCSALLEILTQLTHPLKPTQYVKTHEMCFSVATTLCNSYVNLGQFDKASALLQRLQPAARIFIDNWDSTFQMTLTNFHLQNARVLFLSGKPQEATKLIITLHERISQFFEKQTTIGAKAATLSLFHGALDNLYQIAYLCALSAYQHFEFNLVDQCCALITKPLHAEVQPIVQHAYFTQHDTQALITIQKIKDMPSKTSTHLVYHSDPKLNALRHSLLLAYSNHQIHLIQHYIDELQHMLGQQPPASIQAEILKLLVIANCNFANFHRRNGTQTAQFFLDTALLHRNMADQATPEKYRVTLMPFIDDMINNTQLMIDHTMSPTDILMFKAEFHQLKTDSARSESVQCKQDSPCSPSESLSEVLVKGIPALRDNITQRFVHTTKDLDKQASELVLSMSCYQLIHATPLFLEHFYPASIIDQQMIAVVVNSATTIRETAPDAQQLDDKVKLALQLVNHLHQYQSTNSKTKCGQLVHIATASKKLKSPLLHAQYIMFALMALTKVSYMKATSLNNITNLLLSLLTHQQNNKAINELIMHYIENDFTTLLFNILLNKKANGYHELVTAVNNILERIVQLNAVSKQTQYHYHLLLSISKHIQLEHTHRHDHSKKLITMVLDIFDIAHNEKETANTITRATNVLRELDDVLQGRVRRADTLATTPPSEEIIASYKYFHTELCDLLSNTMRTNDVLNGHTDTLLSPTFDHHSWLCYQEFHFIPPRKHSKTIYESMVKAHNPRKSCTRDLKIVKTFEYLITKDPNNPALHFFLGHYYFHTRSPQAVFHLTQSATQGNLSAKYLLGKVNLRGMFNLPPNIPQATVFFKTCADKKDFFAAYRLARMHQDRIKVILESDSGEMPEKEIHSSLTESKKLMRQYGKLAVQYCPNGPDATESIKTRFGV